MRFRQLAFLAAIVAAFSPCLRAQEPREPTRPLPEVTEHGPLRYPPLARQARITGLVHLQITTDGLNAIGVASEDGHPLLIKTAVANAWTWKFADHVPGTFEVTFNFHFASGSDIGFLRSSGLVEVHVRQGYFEIARNNFTRPQRWNAYLKNGKSDIEAPLSLWTLTNYLQLLQGYAFGAANQQREIRDAHQNGDILGFDASFDDRKGQRLNFSLIGKKNKGKISGVFLDYSGNAGTWMAEQTEGPLPDYEPFAPPAGEQLPTIPIPEIIGHAAPIYPLLANEAGIEGQVRLHVTSRDNRVNSVKAISGDPLLVPAAVANVRTWSFNNHSPGVFDVTFDYRIITGGTTFFQKPGVVDVTELLPYVEAERTEPIPDETWEMQLASPRLNMPAKFAVHLDSFYGVEGEALGSARSSDADIRDGHQDGDMVGFDATLLTPERKKINVSLIGKISGNTVKGVFLDYSGTAGTWTAVRHQGAKH